AYTPSLADALPISRPRAPRRAARAGRTGAAGGGRGKVARLRDPCGARGARDGRRARRAADLGLRDRRPRRAPLPGRRERAQPAVAALPGLRRRAGSRAGRDPAGVAARADPYYYAGLHLEGVGSPHTPKDHVWPIAKSIEGLTTADREEKLRLLHQLIRTDGGTGMMHEGVHVDEPTTF